MNKVWEGHSVTLNDVEAAAKKMGNMLLVATSEKEVIALFSNGRLIRRLTRSTRIFKTVELHQIDKFEFLDYLSKTSDDKQIRENKATEDTIPKVVEFSYSLDAPSTVYVSIEKALTKFSVDVRRDKKIVLKRAELRCEIITGFTGRDILRVQAQLEGYYSTHVELVDLERILEEKISAETGFKTKVIIEKAQFNKTSKLPLLRVRSSFDFKGGRVLEIKLKHENGSIVLTRKQIEQEVEDIITKTGLQSLLVVLKRGSTPKHTDLRSVEKGIFQRLQDAKGLNLKWIKLSPVHDNVYTVSIGVDRTSRKLSNEDIKNLVKKHVKEIESDFRIRGEIISFDKIIIIIEKDIY